MPQPLSPGTVRALLRDMLHCVHDVVGLAAAHGLEEIEVANWLAQRDTQRIVRGVCQFGDCQAQIQIARCRTTAATRLAALIGNKPSEGGAQSEETLRKACVDLLRLQIPGTADDGMEAEPVELELTRAQLYPDEATGDKPAE